ncbi:MAG: S1C family serine protease [Polyangia bacterium]
MPRRPFLMLAISALAWSCATSAEPERAAPGPHPGLGSLAYEMPPPADAAAGPPALVSPAPPFAAPRICDLYAKPGVLKRGPLLRLLDAGLPRWLQGVEGDRALADHRFQGWLVKSIYPDDPCYQDLDLRPGDIVQKVNGKAIERPEQAFDVAQALRTAPALVVDYLRDGKARKLSLGITDGP